LGISLRRAGYLIDEILGRDYPRSRRRARDLAVRLHAHGVTLTTARLAAPVIWICVNDDAIALCARQLAQAAALKKMGWKNKIVLHSSGALSSSELEALRRKGASVASAHPMMTFVSTAPPRMQGIPFALEGDAPAVALARRIAIDLGGEPFTIRQDRKVLYHAMGSFSSPLVIALLAMAEQLARAAGVPRKGVAKVMQPILRRTLENYFSHGAAAAFSGPIQRGDIATVRKHLAALRKVPGAAEIYRALMKSAVRSLPVKTRKKL
jgi:predicted short-subunit dehydrogenase-like oxidoreductase (DUF2520 family)